MQQRMLIELLPFYVLKLSAIGIGYMTNNTFAKRLDRAIDRSDRARLIEGKAVQVQSAEELKKPCARLRRRI
jgi:hypothetical protein